ncbi:MlaD family protein, partial [Nocardioides iriomotensis]
MSRRSSRTVVAFEHRVLGVAFLVLLALFGWLTYAIFSKSFTDYAYVTLQSDKAGLQLPDNADVKIRGVQVGEVRDAESTPEGVRLKLGLYPDSLSTIPADVTAQ